MDYLLGPTRRCGEYTVYLCNVVLNKRLRVLLEVEQYFPWYFAFLCLLDWMSTHYFQIAFQLNMLTQNVTDDILTWGIFLTAPSGMFHITILFLFHRFSRSSSFLSKVATQAESRLSLKVTFTISTSLLVNSRPCFKPLISPDKLAVMGSCCWSLMHRTSWRL